MADRRTKRLTLVASVLGTFVAFLDATVVNIALPAIEEELGGGLAGQQWVVNAYLLTLGSLILIGGSLGDLFGERRMFALGVGGFGAASVLCALAPTIEVLVGARALQGVFGALLTPASLAIIIATFPPAERGAAIGSWTAWSGIAMVVGPVAGGQIVDAVDWRWIFGINVPFVLAAIVLATRVPAPVRGRPRPRLDWVGAVLGALGLAGPVLALIEQPTRGWGDPVVAGGLIGGALLLAAFFWWERRVRDPMLPLDLFGSRNFAWGNVETLCMYGGLGVMGFVLVLFLQQVAGYTALEAGLATLPITFVMFFLARRWGALADRIGPRPFMGTGPLIAAGGLLYLTAAMDPDLDYLTEVFPGVLLFALGLSVTVAPLTAAVMAGASEANAGVASAVNNQVARVAGLVAVAGVGAVVASQLGAPSFDEAAPDAALGAFRAGMGVAAGLLALGGAVGWIMIRDPRKECAEAGVVAEECANMTAMGAPRPDLVHDGEADLPVVERREPAGTR